MITIIFGKPGAGKTSLMTHFMIEHYEKEADDLLDRCIERIAEQNQNRLFTLPFPEQPPFFSNYGVKFLVDYEEEYSPYFFNPYYFGIENDEFEIQYLLPCGYYFITEGQKYFNSRKSLSLRDHVSRAFELHRQNEMNIFIDCQRPKLIDLNIRELAARFLEVMHMESATNGYDGILSSTWYCREFGSAAEVTDYLTTGEGGREIPPIVHRGNIFDAFDSYEQKKKFFPKDVKGSAFTLLPFQKREGLPDKLLKLYDPSEPKWYRSKEKQEESA